MTQTIKPFQWVKNKWNSTEFHPSLSDFTPEKIQSITKFQKTHPLYEKTQLLSLDQLAKYMQVETIKVKDEASRFGLEAFKVVGGIVGIAKYLASLLNKDFDEVSFEELRSDETKRQLGDITFISATDGNHGRGIAWAARELGQNCIVYMPKGSSIERSDAIRREGAYVEITDKNYDDTVRMTEKLANENEWILLQDTAWEGYEDIPKWIMQGYGTIAQEIIEELEKENEKIPTHVFLQVGCGSFAAGIVSYFLQYYKESAPRFVLLEASAAHCYFNSFSSPKGNMEMVGGDMATIMAGLSCGEPSTIAYKILRHHAAGTFSCSDALAALGMRVLSNPLKNDPRITSGESGAAVPLGLIYHLIQAKEKRVLQELELYQDARILLINTEKDTDKQKYLDVVWKGLH